MESFFIGSVVLFAGNFAPRGWALCEGQLLPISQNTALFSILGTTYGGDGRTTFGLPDLRGRVPVGEGRGPGLTERRLGSKGGSESETLSINQIPAHNHSQMASSAPPTRNTPSGAHLASGNRNNSMDKIYAPGVGDVSMSPTGVAGGGQAHNNMQPYLATNYIIALEGVFPSR